MKNILRSGTMMSEGTEQDTEKAEPSTKSESSNKDIEMADILTKPDIEVAESSIEPEVNEPNDREVQILANMKILIDIGAVSPTLVRKGEGSCCIFKIPQTLKKIHHEGYEPEIVSIGPYHHEKDHLQMIQEHKHRFFKLFLNEAKDGITMEVLGKKILNIELGLRNSYSEKLVGFEQPKLLQMMLLDGCFILMLFFIIARKVEVLQDDPILTTPWILSTIRRDLLLLENQVPFILLKILWKESKISLLAQGNLKQLALKFFNISMVKYEEIENLEAEHLLDLIRKNFIHGSSHDLTKTLSSSEYSRLILSAKRLRLQGIEFKASHDHSSSKMFFTKVIDFLFNESNVFIPRSSQAGTYPNDDSSGCTINKKPKNKEKTIVEIQLNAKILEIKLKGNELHIQPIVFDGFISSVLLNCVAFEQLSMKCSNDITSYVVFMGCLINDDADANYLSEKGIIENYFGNGSDVSQFFKNICKDVAFDLSLSYLQEEIKGINKYTSKRWNVECARFKHLHFDSPWTLLSSLVVLVAILLSIIQTTIRVLSYLYSHK